MYLTTSEPKSVFSYHGSKYRMTRYLVPLIPADTNYFAELFCGSAVVSLNLRAIPCILNDLDKNIYNFFCVLRKPRQRTALINLLNATPCDQQTWRDAKAMSLSNAPVDRAWALMIRYQFSLSHFGKAFGCYPMEFGRRRAGAHSALRHKTSLLGSEWIKSFLSRATIINKDALCCLSDLNKKPRAYNILIYADPPYPDTTQDGYKYKYSWADYEALLSGLAQTKHRFILSGFDNKVVRRYTNKHGWDVKSIKASAVCKGSIKTEMVYANFRLSNNLF